MADLYRRLGPRAARYVDEIIIIDVTDAVDKDIFQYNDTTTYWENVTQQASGFLVNFENDSTTGELTVDKLFATGTTVDSMPAVTLGWVGTYGLSRNLNASVDNISMWLGVNEDLQSWIKNPGGTSVTINAAADAFSVIPDSAFTGTITVATSLVLVGSGTPHVQAVSDNLNIRATGAGNIVAINADASGADGGLCVYDGGVTNNLSIKHNVITNNTGTLSFTALDLSTTGDLNIGAGGTVLDVDSSLETVGIGTTAKSGALLTLSDVREEDNSFFAFSGSAVITPTVAAKRFGGLSYEIFIDDKVGATVDIASVKALSATVNFLASNAVYTTDEVVGLGFGLNEYGGGKSSNKTITDLYHVKVEDPVTTATLLVGTEYGLRLPDMALGTTAWSLYLLGGDSSHLGDMRIGGVQDAAPIGKLDVVGVTNLGDGGTTNYSTFEADGTLEFNGAATVWKDINLGAAMLARPAASQPSEGNFIDENGADTGITTLAFADGDKVSGSIELQHDYLEGSDIYFHVHWQGVDAPTGTDYVKWQLTYTVTRTDTTLNAAATQVVETAFDTRYEFIRSDFPAITGTSFLMGDQLLFTLDRITAVGDAYAGEALVATVGVHYEIDTVGSRTIITK